MGRGAVARSCDQAVDALHMTGVLFEIVLKDRIVEHTEYLGGRRIPGWNIGSFSLSACAMTRREGENAIRSEMSRRSER